MTARVRPTGVFKRSNEYARLIPDYDTTPKAVFAALALSFAARCSDGDVDDIGAAVAALREEWRILNVNGIVPQKPRGEVRS